MSFWDILWFIVISFSFIAYLMMLYAILMDLLRDQHTGAVAKVVWLVALFFLPLLTALAYVLVRGAAMADRMTGGPSPSDQIARARTMLDDGTISQSEFDTLKARALTA